MSELVETRSTLSDEAATTAGDGVSRVVASANSPPSNFGENRQEARTGRSRHPITTVPLDDCLRHLARQEAAFVRHTTRAGLVRLTEDGTLTFGENRLRIEGPGFGRLAARFAAPVAYITRLPGHLQRGVLEHDFRRTFPDDAELEIVAREGRFETLTERSLCSLMATEVVGAVADAVRPLVGEVQVRIVGSEQTAGAVWVDGGSVRIQLLTLNEAFDAIPGDVVRAGMQVTHSPLGEHATWIEAYFDRLVCSNGMTIRECVGRKGGAGRTRRLPANHPDARQLQLEQVQRLATTEWSALADRMAAMRRLEERRIDDVPLLFARWLERARLSVSTLVPRLRRAWEDEGARPTLWGAVNAFTDVGTHGDDLPYRVRRLLSGLGGVLAFRERHLCSRCFSRLTGSAAAPERPDTSHQ